MEENKKTFIIQIAVIVLVVVAALFGGPALFRKVYAPKTVYTYETAYEKLINAQSIEFSGNLNDQGDEKKLAISGNELGTAVLSESKTYVLTCNDDEKIIASMMPTAQSDGYECLDVNGETIGWVYGDSSSKERSARITDASGQQIGSVKFTNASGKMNASWNIIDESGKIDCIISWTYSSLSGDITYIISPSNHDVNSVQILAVIEVVNSYLK